MKTPPRQPPLTRGQARITEFGIQNTEDAMKPLHPEPALTDRVRDAIVDAILDGSLLPGDRLAQEHLAERLGVSRQPVSHALRLLREQGILVALGRKGLTVAPMDPALVRQLYQVRAALDALAARLCAERFAAGELVGHDLRDLDALVRRFAPRTGAERDGPSGLARRINADMAFHTGLYRLSGNPQIEAMTRPHWVHFRRSMRAVLTNPDAPPPAWDEHRAILDAVRRGDARAAERLALDHCRSAAEKACASIITIPGLEGDAA